MPDDVIVIPTHYSGISWLNNLLRTLEDYTRYPILIVINEYRPAHNELFQDVLHRFQHLPLEIRHRRTNSFEFGALLTAYEETDFENFFLLPHSCEIVNVELFEMVFELHRGRSVALALEGQRTFWHGNIGKFRRSVLDSMNLKKYLPYHIVDAVLKTEVYFTVDYHRADPDTAILFPDWIGTNIFEETFDGPRMKISNEYIVKWKSIWNWEMLHERARKQPKLPYWLSILRCRWFCYRNHKKWFGLPE